METTYYVYDAQGQRVRKITETANATRANERIYLGGYEIYREYDATGSTVTLERDTLHIMDDKRRVALVETNTIDSTTDQGPALTSTTRYQFENHLGSACLELDENAAIISYEEYYPYGSTSYQAGPNAAEVGLKRYRYAGKERDEETGLYYYGARYSAPWLGRWTSCDPAGLTDGPNLYLYVRCNPVGITDLSGLQGTDPQAMPNFTIRMVGEDGRVTTTTVGQAHGVDHPSAPDATPAKPATVATSAGASPNKPSDIDRIASDFKTLDPDKFDAKYGDMFSTWQKLELAALRPPLQLTLPAPDTTLYMGEGGRTGTLENLELAEKGDQLAAVQPSNVTGTLYGAAALFLGASSQEASRMISIGNQVGDVTGTFAMVAGMLSAPTTASANDNGSPPTLEEREGSPAPIFGTAQTTGGATHAADSQAAADELASIPGMQKVAMNSSYSRQTKDSPAGGVSTSRLKPDALGITDEGKVTTVEIPSPSDVLVGRSTSPSLTKRAIINRNLKVHLRLGEFSEGIFILGATPEQAAPIFNLLTNR